MPTASCPSMSHLGTLLARVALLSSPLCSLVILLGMLDTGPLRRLAGLSLRLRCRSHEGDQRITDGLLHRVFGRPVEREIVDHRSDHHATPHELADCVAHILVIASEAINPTNHKHITSPQLVEQATTLGA